MTDYDDMKRGTARDWFWARAVLIGGFVIAIAVAGYFGWRSHQESVAEQQMEATAPTAPAISKKAAHQAELDAKAKGAMMFCAIDLLNAKNMGVVPPFGQLASPLPEKTDKQGRYACTAATDVSKYKMEADLVCRQISNPACVKLHSVTSDDGTVLYSADKK
jgi:hypothetical protein